MIAPRKPRVPLFMNIMLAARDRPPVGNPYPAPIPCLDEFGTGARRYILGTLWPSKENLERYLWQCGKRERRDHRRLGSELDLLSIQLEVRPRLVLLHPKGVLVSTLMENYWRQEHRAGGYDFVATSHIGRSVLWETSGHLQWYREGMYAPIDIEDAHYYLKPMNCPFHC